MDCARNDPFRGSSTRCLIGSFSAFGRSAIALYAMRGSDFAYTVNWVAPALPAARWRFARVAGVAGAASRNTLAAREAMIASESVVRNRAVGRKRVVLQFC